MYDEEENVAGIYRELASFAKGLVLFDNVYILDGKSLTEATENVTSIDDSVALDFSKSLTEETLQRYN